MEKSGIRILDLVEFYPRWDNFITEGKGQDIPKSAKITETGKVYTQDGEEIDMAHLTSEMESAKTAIISQSPLFAPYVHQFTPIYTWLVPTMATDGLRLFVNPKFANDLTWEQKIFVIIHEIMHCVLLHMDRQGGKDPNLFNIAADLEINPLIVDTLEDFDEKFIEAIPGLYDKKYLNQPVEAIYRDILKNAPKMPKLPNNQGGAGPQQGGSCPDCGGSGQQPGQPGQGQGGGAQEISVGAKVKVKSTGQKGVVTAINPDGTYEIDPINESFYPTRKELLFEGYTREQIVPISDGGEGGEGEGQGGGGEEGEGEGQGGGGEEGEGGDGGSHQCPSCGGSGKQGGQGGAGSPGAGGIYKKMQDSDPAGTGGVITAEEGRKIAEQSGYDVEAGEAGPNQNAGDKWNAESQKLFDKMKGSNEYGKGKGGYGLFTTLARLHKGEINWQNQFKRFVARALSPETYQKIGNKKHLGREYLKYGEKNKMDAIEHIVVLVDVSGSMSDDVLERILNEINAIIFSKRVKKITIAFFDDGVDKKSVQTIKRAGKPFIPKDVDGRGGTNFQTALDWVGEAPIRNRVSLLVFMTDGYAPMPTKPKYHNKFIWVIYDNPGFEQPFGKIINLS